MAAGFWSKLQDVGSKIWNGVKTVAKNVVKPLANIAAPILSSIPHPYAQVAGQAVNFARPIIDRIVGE